MKKLIAVFLVLFAKLSFASLPDIVALVNDEPITKYDFQARKSMIISLNGVDVSDPNTELSLNRAVIQSLVNEELLHQHTGKVGGTITKEQIDNAIANIESKNSMPQGGMRSLFKEKSLDINSFRRQIATEIIKARIINSMNSSVAVSPAEIDVALVNASTPNYDIEAWSFTSGDSTVTTHKKMKALAMRLKDCNKIDPKLYNEFAEAEKFDRKFEQMPASTKSVVYDTKAGSVSSVYKENDKFKLIFVCKKEPKVPQEDLLKVKTFLSNKKLSHKANKFFKDLHTGAYIKIMIPN